MKKELYEMIEKKIRESGYPRPIVGSDVYGDICDQCLKITHSACHGTGIQKNIPPMGGARPPWRRSQGTQRRNWKGAQEIRTLAEISCPITF